MKLPNAERAIVEIRKLKDYCLSTSHPRGRHKARVFATVLGLTADDSVTLCNAILTAVQNEEALPRETDQYGQRFVVDFPMEYLGKQAMIRSSWIVRTGESVPRLTSCYIL